MNRRDFVLGAAAIPALRRALVRPGPRFGCAAITWGGDDRAAIRDISELRFPGIQLRASAVAEWGKRPAELKDLLAERSLTLVALSSGVVRIDPSAHGEDMALHVRNAHFVRDVGGLYLQVVDERPTGRDPEPGEYARMGRYLTELGRQTADLGVSLGYHNHMGNLGQAPDEVARVLDAADPRFVRLELDVAHYQAAGGDPARAVQRHADRLLFLHLKDLQRPVPGGRAGSYRFVELGRGEVDIRGVLGALERVGFGGWVVVELDSVTEPGRTPREASMISREFLASNGYAI